MKILNIILVVKLKIHENLKVLKSEYTNLILLKHDLNTINR